MTQNIEFWTCRQCWKLVRIPAKTTEIVSCPRCSSMLNKRKVNSIARTWAFLIAAVLLYVPANIFPMLVIERYGGHTLNTIVSGIGELFASGMWGVGLIIFFASIVVPTLKIVGLTFLVLSVQTHSKTMPLGRNRLYLIIESIGRWSMIDVFVVALMSGLVSLGSIATVAPGFGATCFGAVVVLTIFAAQSFDSRLIWDEAGSN